LLAEEFTLRENRRVKTALVMAGLSTTKTLAGFDVAFQPSLDKNRIMALAELKFIDRAEVLHLVGPPELDSYCPSRYPVIVPALLAADRRTPDAGSGALVRPVCLGALQINEDHA
jgi:IstB-like ATP binding protein